MSQETLGIQRKEVRQVKYYLDGTRETRVSNLGRERSEVS